MGARVLINETRYNQFLDAQTNIFIQDGRQENLGFEVNVFGEPIRGLRFITGAATIDATLLKTSGGLFDGKKAPSVPFYEYRWAGEVDLPWVAGLTLTSAVLHSGPAPFDNANTFNVPAWTRFDLGARYVWWIDTTKMIARLSVENITHQAYWISGYGSGALSLSAPRAVIFSLTADLTPSGPPGLPVLPRRWGS
jgi:iron complex outermembrane receptor protein